MIIAPPGIYLPGHTLAPTHWPVLREWLCRGSLIAVFLTTLFASLKLTSDRS